MRIDSKRLAEIVNAQSDILRMRESVTEQETLKRYEQAATRIEAETNKAMLQVERLRVSGEPLDSAMFRLNRYQALQQQIDSEIQKVTGPVLRQVQTNQAFAAGLGQQTAFQTTHAILNSDSPDRSSVTRIMSDWTRLPKDALDDLIGYMSNGKPLMNMLQNISSATAEHATRILTEGLAIGKNPRVVAREMRQSTGMAANRALTISRTEMLRSYRESSRRAFTANAHETGGVVKGWIWHSALDSRCCSCCIAMHGQVFKVEEKLNGHPNCFPADTIVLGPNVNSSSARWFDGKIVKIKTQSGNFLTVTPNHPILTSKGWVAAGLLKEGNDVISSNFKKGIFGSVRPNNNNIPSRIKDMAESFCGTDEMITRSVIGTSEDFHNDGMDSQISIIRSDGLLRNGFDSFVQQPLLQQQFIIRAMQLSLLSGFSALNFGFDRVDLSSSCVLCGNGIEGVFRFGSVSHHQLIRLFLISYFYSIINQHSNNSISGTTDNFRNSIYRHSADVFKDQIIGVWEEDFRGHVYNLETEEGWYVANGIIAHNCRCAMVPKTATWEELGFTNIPDTNPIIEKGSEWFNKQPESIQKAILGPGKLNLYQGNRITLADTVTVKVNPVWGSVRTEASIAESLQNASVRRMMEEAEADKIRAQQIVQKAQQQFEAQTKDAEIIRKRFKKERLFYRDKEPIVREFVEKYKSDVAVSQQHHGMPSPEDMFSIHVEGVNYHFTEETYDTVVGSLVTVFAEEQLPEYLTQYTKDIYFTIRRNRNDAYWEVQFNIPNFRSAATGGTPERSVVYYNGGGVDIGTLAHEMAHNLAYQLYGTATPPDDSLFMQLANKKNRAGELVEQPVREYGTMNPAEDLATSFEAYFENKYVMKKNFPNRYKAVMQMLKGKT